MLKASGAPGVLCVSQAARGTGSPGGAGVHTFHDLERQLTIAAQKNDQSTLNRLLANEFEGRGTANRKWNTS